MRGPPADLSILFQAGALGGVAAIAAERQRHATAYPLDYGRIKGYSAEHDDHLTDDSLALAGAAYALPLHKGGFRFRLWPQGWGDSPDHSKFHDLDARKRELEKAGALIAAEWDRLDRLQRAQAAENGDDPPPQPTIADPAMSREAPTP